MRRTLPGREDRATIARMYREATTVHGLSTRGRRSARFVACSMALAALAALATTWPLRYVHPRLGAIATVAFVGFLIEALGSLRSRVELRPGGVLTVVTARRSITVSATQVASLMAIRADSWLLFDARGRLLAEIPPNLEHPELIAAWLHDHVVAPRRAPHPTSREERLAAAGLTEDEVERFWASLGRVSALALLACAANLASWIAGPTWNRWGVLSVALSAAVIAWRSLRHRDAFAFGARSRGQVLAFAMAPVLGLVMNAALNLRETLDTPRLVACSLPLAIAFVMGLLPLLDALRREQPSSRAVRVALALAALLLAPSLVQLADTLFDPLPELYTEVDGVITASSTGRDAARHVAFTLAGQRRETLFAPPLREGFRAEPGAPVTVTIGRGLVGVPYVREVSPR